MSKKHYLKIAAIFKAKLGDPYPQTELRTAILKDVATSLCEVLKDDNPNFDRTRFLEACGF